MLLHGQFASTFTHATLATAATVPANLAGGSINVYGIVLSNIDGTARDFTIADNDGTSIAVVAVAAQETVVIDVPFLADNGLTISADVADAAATVTVFHSQPGA